MKLCIVGRGSFYRKLIEACNSNVTDKMGRADVIYNWGLAGQRFRDWANRSAKWIGDKTILNMPVNQTKWTQLGIANKAGIPCLESQRENPGNSEWVFKPDFSLGGKHIQVVTDRFRPPVSGYYQRFIPGKDRKYEIRVHACDWREESEYLVQKRVCDNVDSVTWNHHTGGRFITVKEPREYRIFRDTQSLSKRILDVLRISHGGVDFIVNHDGEIFFLEINTSIGLRIPQTLDFWTESFNILAGDEL